MKLKALLIAKTKRNQTNHNNFRDAIYKQPPLEKVLNRTRYNKFETEENVFRCREFRNFSAGSTSSLLTVIAVALMNIYIFRSQLKKRKMFPLHNLIQYTDRGVRVDGEIENRRSIKSH